MNSQEPQSSEGRLSEIWTLALFKKLQALYLSKWTTALEGIEEIAMVEWSRELSGLSGQQIKQGLANLTDSWPPSAIEFRSLCEGRGKNGFGLDYIPEYHRPQKRPDRLLSSDERDERRKEVSSKAMNGLRNILKNKRGSEK